MFSDRVESSDYSRAANLPRMRRSILGTMRLRSPGSWELIVSAGVDPRTGGYKRVIRTIKTTSKREAKAALAKLETEVAQGLVSAEDITLADLLDRWIEHIDGLGRSPMTLYHYRQTSSGTSARRWVRSSCRS